jgi:hypothetical protein
LTALPAIKAARPALLRPWREAVWRDQDYWTWLLIILGVLLAIRLLVLVFAETDLSSTRPNIGRGRAISPSAISRSPHSSPGSFASPRRFAARPNGACGRHRPQGAKSVLTDNRDVIGQLLYYLRDSSLPITVSYRGEALRNHFDMTRPFPNSAPEPVLYVTLNRGMTSVPKRFHSAQVIGEQLMLCRCAKGASIC